MAAPGRGITRRDFVRRAAAGAAVVGAGAAGASALLGGSKGSLGRPYYGLNVIYGPAVRGLPLIPVRMNGNGHLEGVPQDLETYRFCGIEGAPGLSPDYRGGNLLHYDAREEQVSAAQRAGMDLWWASRLGDRIHADDFPEMWAGAPFRWRSEGQSDRNVIRGIVIRVRREMYPRTIRENFLVNAGYLAVLSYCTHFCCVCGYKQSSSAEELGFEDAIFCDCHFATYDIRDVRAYRTPASGETPAGGHKVA